MDVRLINVLRGMVDRFFHKDLLIHQQQQTGGDSLSECYSQFSFLSVTVYLCAVSPLWSFASGQGSAGSCLNSVFVPLFRKINIFVWEVCSAGTRHFSAHSERCLLRRLHDQTVAWSQTFHRQMWITMNRLFTIYLDSTECNRLTKHYRTQAFHKMK